MDSRQPAEEQMPEVPLVDRMAWQIQGWDAVTPSGARTQGEYLHLASVLLTMMQGAEEDRDIRLAGGEE